MALHIIDGEKIKTRRDGWPYAWSATSDNYDASYEGAEDGWVASHPVGYGATEQEAIDDYLALVEGAA